MTPTEILDHPVVGQRYLFPMQAPIPGPFVVQVPGAELHCYRSAPLPGAPTVLHFHGNGEVVSDWMPDFVPPLNAAGLNVVLAEYRGYGGSTGEPLLATMLDDAVAIADACGVPPEALVVYGRSVGSIYALHVAAERPVAGLVIESGIADVLQRLRLRLHPDELGTTDEGLRDAVDRLVNHRAKIEAFRGPVRIFHAAGDDLVPPTHAQQLADWAGERAVLRLFERGDHNTIHLFNGAAIKAEVVRFVWSAVKAG